MTIFKLGDASISELKTVHKDLVLLVKRAFELTVQDFAVHDGTRSVLEQKNLMAAGASKTMDSRHLTGHAVDLVPYINGKLRWEWEPIYKIADVVRIAARELELPITWGGAWDINFTDSEALPEYLVSDYVARLKKSGKKAFIDGPHFELSRRIYP